MPTSASTGSKQVSTSGDTKAKSKKDEAKVEDKVNEKDKNVLPEPEPQTVPAVDAEGEVKAEVPVEKADDVRQIKPDYAPKAEQTPAQSKGPSQLNSPDGAPIKTDPEDLHPGERADFPPSPPQNYRGKPNDPNNSGIIHAVNRQGAHVSFAAADPDLEEKLRTADPKHPSLPKKG